MPPEVFRSILANRSGLQEQNAHFLLGILFGLSETIFVLFDVFCLRSRTNILFY